jgi:hypothetical protein
MILIARCCNRYYSNADSFINENIYRIKSQHRETTTDTILPGIYIAVKTNRLFKQQNDKF